LSSVEIDAAGPGDAPQLVAAYEWLFAPPGSQPSQWDPQAAADRLRHAATAADSVVLVARAGGALAGICTTYLDLESVRFGRRAWVEDLAVHPERRSLGIGKRLLDAAKDWARERGATHLELDSGRARTDAHRFYEREEPSWSSISFGWEL
jgi:GNAT superfamily N-acetyltransferase